MAATQCLRAGVASTLRLSLASSRPRPQGARLATSAAAQRRDGAPTGRSGPKKQPAAPPPPPPPLPALPPLGRAASGDPAAAPHLQGLSQEQLSAVDAPLGAVRVVAGPGSGKTRVLVSRVAHLIAAHGVRPWQILAITFTSKAAKEMEERLEILLGEGLHKKLTACTMHSLCFRLLHQYIQELPDVGRTNSFTVYDQGMSTRLLAQAVAAEHPDRKPGVVSDKAAELQGLISRVKSSMETWHAATPQAAAAHFDQAARKLWGDPKHQAMVTDLTHWFERYEAGLRTNNALDFDDMMGTTVALLRHHQNLRRRLQSRMRHVLVDEFQDTNIAQYALVRLLVAQQESLFVVGDPDQSIYGWRGAEMTNMTRQLPADYKTMQTYSLRDNYRSTARIVATADHVIRANTDWERLPLRALLHEGEEIVAHQARNVWDEASYIAAEVQKQMKAGVDPRQIALLFRMHWQSKKVEEELVRRGIPYVVIAGKPFWQRAEIQDLMAYLLLVVGLRDEVALRRIINTPKRGFGPKALEQLTAYAREHSTTLPALLFGSEAAQHAAGGGSGGGGADGISALQLPALPDRKELGLGPKAFKELHAFRELIARLHATACTAPLGTLLAAIVEETGYKAYVQQGGSGSKDEAGAEGEEEGEEKGGQGEQQKKGKEEKKTQSKGDPTEKIERIMLLIESADNFEDVADPLGLLEEDARPRAPLPPLELARAFLAEAALYSATDEDTGEKMGVRLMTVHASKGTEYEVVFILGLVEDSWIRRDEPQVQDARRLFYVAVTRAKHRLYLTHPRFNYSKNGYTVENSSCRFIEEVLRAGHASTTWYGDGMDDDAVYSSEDSD